MGFVGLVELLFHLFLLLIARSHSTHGQLRQEDNIVANSSDVEVHLFQQKNQVVMSNGIVTVAFTAPAGHITSITYKGGENLLETQNKEDNRGYWDVVWGVPGGPKGGMDKLSGTSYKIIRQSKDQTEISFNRIWAVGNANVPLNVDKRFVMLRGVAGFYSYTVVERLKGWPAFGIGEARVVFKLQENKFHYMAMSDERQRIMPMPEDRIKGRILDYPEAVLLTNPSNPHLKGEVDDKYLYSCKNEDNKVHGWVSNDRSVPVGFWIITPTDEFRTGGPLKQDLTSHVGPTSLSMFISSHYAGYDLSPNFESGEYWKKVFGPVFVYLNSDVRANSNPAILWNDAKKQMMKEVASWPYTFPLSPDFLKPNQRGTVTGQLLVHDKFIDKQNVPAAGAYVGLALPGEVGSWQKECKGYQFWTRADRNGQFVIRNVVPGTYSLYAWVPGRIGDYKHASVVTITPGSVFRVSNAVFEPPRRGATLWEIGIPDRTAAEFFIPDPSPSFKIHSYTKPTEKFRQYGLWSRYNELYPRNDLSFTVGVSDYRKDWFFAHVNRNVGNAATWQILFDLKKVNPMGNYTLQLALASANGAEVQVRLNDVKSPAHYTTGLIGRDNAVARHGIHGLYHLYSIVVGSKLKRGRNTIFLTQARTGSPFNEVMYDYIRLEGTA